MWWIAEVFDKEACRDPSTFLQIESLVDDGRKFDSGGDMWMKWVWLRNRWDPKG